MIPRMSYGPKGSDNSTRFTKMIESIYTAMVAAAKGPIDTPTNQTIS